MSCINEGDHMSEANDYPLSPVTEIVTAPSIRTAQKDGAYNWQAREFQAGDAIDALARYYINHWNAKALPTALRERRLAISEYRHFITTMYPLVVGFTMADSFKVSRRLRNCNTQSEPENSLRKCYKLIMYATQIKSRNWLLNYE